MIDLTHVIEEAMRTGTLPNSTTGTVRAVGGAVLKSIRGNAAQYAAIKRVLADEYEREGTLTPTYVGMFAKRAAVAVQRALDEIPEKPEERVEEPVHAAEEPTVESMSATLIELGRLNESAPEALNDAIQNALRRFGLAG